MVDKAYPLPLLGVGIGIAIAIDSIKIHILKSPCPFAKGGENGDFFQRERRRRGVTEVKKRGRGTDQCPAPRLKGFKVG